MKLSVMLSGASLGALMLGSAAVSAAPVTLNVCSGTVCWSGNYQIADGVVVNWTNVDALENSGGISTNEWEAGKGINVSDWSLTMDSDPFVTNNFTITNTGASTQTYTLGTSMGVVPAIPNGLMRGSIGFSLTDNNGNGATMATSGASIYSAMIDTTLTPARTLWDPVTSFTSPFGTTSSSTFFGFPTREAAPESIDSTIGIVIKFSLTPGDSVSFTSNFDVVPVPVPAAVWLFGSGLLGLFGVSRRKRR